MQYLAPNIKLERRIVSILLNKPENVETVDIKGEWFQVPNMKALFLAIYLKPRVNDYIEWIRLAKDEGFQGQFSDVQQIHDEFITDSTLKGLVRSLKHDYLDRLFLDADDSVKKNPTRKNKQRLVELLQMSDELDIDKFNGDLNDTGKDAKYALYHEQPIGIQAKEYPRFNNIFGGGIYGGALITIGARPSVGKSAFMVNLVHQIAQLDKSVHIDIFTMEMSKREIFDRFVSCIGGLDSNWLRDAYHRIPAKFKPNVEKTMDEIISSNIHVYDQTSDLDSILSVMKENASQLKSGKYIAFVDYVGIIEVKDQQERYLQIGKISRSFKNLANDYDCPIIEFAQLNRSVENREDQHPKLSDLRESGSLEQDSNICAFLSVNPQSEDIVNKMEHDPEEEKIIDMNVAKNRAGRLCMINYLFGGSKMEMTEIAR